VNSKRYIQVSLAKAIENQYPGYEDYDGWRDDYELSWLQAIYECDGGVPVRLVATDGGEPEDNSFNRDGAWIVRELNRAAGCA
jgi:hypothetical protein